jgi:hypothetical protein
MFRERECLVFDVYLAHAYLISDFLPIHSPLRVSFQGGRICWWAVNWHDFNLKRMAVKTLYTQACSRYTPDPDVSDGLLTWWRRCMPLNWPLDIPKRPRGLRIDSSDRCGGEDGSRVPRQALY